MDSMLAECQRVIGYHFANPRLLHVALTHSSLRTPDRECNERLEFLGDSVLGLVITEELYRLLPDQAEGELTRIKSAVVSRGALFRASQRLGLVRFAEFARGVGRKDELPVSVTANLFESVMGAIYLDAGYFPAREFVLRHLGHELEETLSDRGAKNHKSLLQHEVQDSLGTTPTYRTLEEGGPDHRKQFVVAAILRGQEWGRAAGPTKKEAEQEAARRALEAFQRRGRGRRRRRPEQGEGAREVGAHVDDAEGMQQVHGRPGPEATTSHAPIGREPDVEPQERIAFGDPPVPLPRAAPAPPSPPAPTRPRAPARPAAPAPRQPQPSVDGFAEGLGAAPPPQDSPSGLRPGGPASPRTASPSAAPAVGPAPGRKKAPSAWTPPPSEEGFDSGL
jgi:ribonuclease-3